VQSSYKIKSKSDSNGSPNQSYNIESGKFGSTRDRDNRDRDRDMENSAISEEQFRNMEMFSDNK